MERATLGHQGKVVSGSASIPSIVSVPVTEPEPLVFERVYDEHFQFVWRMARRLGVAGGSVDDVVQETFLVVHRRLHEFEGRSSLRTWLYGIALRVVHDHRRSIRRKSPHLGAEPTDPDTLYAHGTGPYQARERAEAVELLHGILDTLADDRREVLVLAELEELSAPDIAEVTGTNVNTVYTRLRAARADFQAALARHRLRSEGRTP
jgi:RNA polymerase sigma-70 factor (ECF subfamily)